MQSSLKVAVRIGELAAIDPDALRFSFDALTRETDMEGLMLEIEVCPRRHRCDDCGMEFDVKDFVFAVSAMQQHSQRVHQRRRIGTGLSGVGGV